MDYFVSDSCRFVVPGISIGCENTLLQLVLMRWRKVPPTVIVSAMIEGKKAGIELYRDLLEAHYLAGGHVPRWCMLWYLLRKPISI